MCHRPQQRYGRGSSNALDRVHHPAVGDLDLAYESFPLATDLSQSLLTYTAEPGSPTQDALTLLASWAASTTHHSKRQRARIHLNNAGNVMD